MSVVYLISADNSVGPVWSRSRRVHWRAMPSQTRVHKAWFGLLPISVETLSPLILLPCCLPYHTCCWGHGGPREQ